MKKLFIFVLVLPFFFACSDDDGDIKPQSEIDELKLILMGTRWYNDDHFLRPCEDYYHITFENLRISTNSAGQEVMAGEMFREAFGPLLVP